MKTAVILASGESMSQALAESVRGRADLIIAISDVYKIAPWAHVLVSNDSKWWRVNRKEAMKFAGRRFCGGKFPGTEHIRPSADGNAGSNSGLQGMRVARDYYRVDKIILLGFDQKGDHFFGKHRLPLKNTSPKRREEHKRQFARFDQSRCKVVNCTEGSALTCFAFGKLDEELGNELLLS